ncbi:UDP-N-acetylglucosamine 2-epimerase [Neptuniibacter sp. QD29_5]|uniref:UDP-N-acetylglucosamine 2-epimerase n=1 Tax=Neptuniibacter sp. QD29_5 TaxID=3398207 RepID=UPI0039F5DB4B
MRVGVFTGSRANYSSTKTIIRGLETDPNIDLISIVGGAATLSRYGAIHELMVDDGLPKPDYIFNMYIDGESHGDMAKSCGLGIMEMSTILTNANLDAIVVVGDRYDVMAPVIAAAYMNIAIVHTMGGEVTGTIDESIRHAITKFAHLHLVANEDAKERIIKMGEPEETVQTVGCPRMDLVKEAIENDTLRDKDFFEKYKGVGGNVSIEGDFLLVSFHPVTTEADDLREQVDSLMLALNEIKMPTIMIWPNFDAGSSAIAKSIRTFREKENPQWLHLQTNFSVEDYSRLMSRALCLVGNSSSGLREGAFIGTPVVNIGSRQNSRLSAHNVIHCEPKTTEIVDSIKVQLQHGKYKSSFLYGDGKAGQKIVSLIKNLDPKKVQKRINY